MDSFSAHIAAAARLARNSNPVGFESEVPVQPQSQSISPVTQVPSTENRGHATPADVTAQLQSHSSNSSGAFQNQNIAHSLTMTASGSDGFLGIGTSGGNDSGSILLSPNQSSLMAPFGMEAASTFRPIQVDPGELSGRKEPNQTGFDNSNTKHAQETEWNNVINPSQTAWSMLEDVSTSHGNHAPIMMNNGPLAQGTLSAFSGQQANTYTTPANTPSRVLQKQTPIPRHGNMISIQETPTQSTTSHFTYLDLLASLESQDPSRTPVVGDVPASTHHLQAAQFGGIFTPQHPTSSGSGISSHSFQPSTMMPYRNTPNGTATASSNAIEGSANAYSALTPMHEGSCNNIVTPMNVVLSSSSHGYPHQISSTGRKHSASAAVSSTSSAVVHPYGSPLAMLHATPPPTVSNNGNLNLNLGSAGNVQHGTGTYATLGNQAASGSFTSIATNVGTGSPKQHLFSNATTGAFQRINHSATPVGTSTTNKRVTGAYQTGAMTPQQYPIHYPTKHAAPTSHAGSQSQATMNRYSNTNSNNSSSSVTPTLLPTPRSASSSGTLALGPNHPHPHHSMKHRNGTSHSGETNSPLQHALVRSNCTTPTAMMTTHGTGSGCPIQSEGMGTSCQGTAMNPLSAFGTSCDVLQLVREENGCRYLQEVLAVCDAATVDYILRQILSAHAVADIMSSKFGNYFVQKLLEVLDADQLVSVIHELAPSIIALSLNPRGTYGIRRLVDVIRTPLQADLLTRCILSSPIVMTCDTNGSQVCRRLIKKFSSMPDGPALLAPVLHVVASNILQLGRDQQGCCVVQRCFDAADADQKEALTSAVIQVVDALVVDQYGNYVVQHVLDMGNSDMNVRLTTSLLYSDVAHLARNKYSSNVIEKCLTQVPQDVADILIMDLCHRSVLPLLLCDEFGNYVVQRAMKRATGVAAQMLEYSIRPLLNTIPAENVRRKIDAKLKEMRKGFHSGAQPQQQSMQMPIQSSPSQFVPGHPSQHNSNSFKSSTPSSNPMVLSRSASALNQWGGAPAGNSHSGNTNMYHITIGSNTNIQNNSSSNSTMQYLAQTPIPNRAGMTMEDASSNTAFNSDAYHMAANGTPSGATGNRLEASPPPVFNMHQPSLNSTPNWAGSGPVSLPGVISHSYGGQSQHLNRIFSMGATPDEEDTTSSPAQSSRCVSPTAHGNANGSNNTMVPTSDLPPLLQSFCNG